MKNMKTDTNKISKFKYIRYIICFILALTFAFAVPFTINAGVVLPDDPIYTGPLKGFAVYRNGVINNIEDHAALMVESNTTTYTYPIVHAAGSNSNVQLGTWSSFLGGQTFLGFYKPSNCIITNSLANSFEYKARELIGKPYTFVSQITYSAGTDAWVTPSKITSMRCDGVVEYVYEWFGYRVGGSNIGWDISQNNPVNFAEHSGILITPRKQRTQLLDFIQT